MKRRLLAVAAACLVALGALADHVITIQVGQPDTASARTSYSTSAATSSSQQGTENAYRTASASVVYVASAGLGSGSGIIYDSKGDIVTNNHVIDGAKSISVTLSNGKTYAATLVGTDTADDLAVIRVKAPNLTVAHFAKTGEYQVGETVLAIGNPLGLKGSVTSGLISGLHRVEQEENGAYLSDAVQTSAPINPGNSGGALVTLDGTVVGMPTLEQTSSSQGASTQGIGFAIPSERIVTVANQIINGGKVAHTGRPYLGIAPSDSSGQWNGRFGGGTATPSGAVVSQVASDGPAARAGVRQGDVITAADGTTVTDAQDLLSVLAHEKPGNTIILKIDRNGTKVTATVRLGELPATS